MNFLDFFVVCVEMQELGMVRQMANQEYERELKRDSALYEKVNAVCEKYFDGEGIKRENPM